ncbi:MAG TPA: hypothetical protein VE075_09480 [Thermoanaerobaculia bacterium]|nr:hypothetical protein [Thermoanaerobaculia bacterium]
MPMTLIGGRRPSATGSSAVASPVGIRRNGPVSLVLLVSLVALVALMLCSRLPLDGLARAAAAAGCRVMDARL